MDVKVRTRVETLAISPSLEAAPVGSRRGCAADGAAGTTRPRGAIHDALNDEHEPTET